MGWCLVCRRSSSSSLLYIRPWLTSLSLSRSPAVVRRQPSLSSLLLIFKRKKILFNFDIQLPPCALCCVSWISWTVFSIDILIIRIDHWFISPFNQCEVVWTNKTKEWKNLKEIIFRSIEFSIFFLGKEQPNDDVSSCPISSIRARKAQHISVGGRCGTSAGPLDLIQKS
jgi:hypothetical protein